MPWTLHVIIGGRRYPETCATLAQAKRRRAELKKIYGKGFFGKNAQIKFQIKQQI